MMHCIRKPDRFSRLSQLHLVLCKVCIERLLDDSLKVMFELDPLLNALYLKQERSA